MPDDAARSEDEALVARLASGDEEALRVLHRRHAPLVFTVAARLVDGPTAEEVTQDVFVTLWTKHATFDPARGSLKTWLCQIARHRATNAKRHGKARRSGEHDGDAALEQIADESATPDEARWIAQRKAALTRALDTLPPEQRTALTLAFFDDLTHEQIAATLHTPVGTTKTRIRGAMKRLAPVLLGLLAVATLVVVWLRAQRDRSQNARALQMVTSSDVVPLRLVPPGAPTDPPSRLHGTYRGRPGVDVGVLTASALPPLDSGSEYDGWIRHGTQWIRLGPLVPRDDGGALVVAEDSSLVTAADEIRITVEAHAGPTPNGPVVVVWPISSQNH